MAKLADLKRLPLKLPKNQKRTAQKLKKSVKKAANKKTISSNKKVQTLTYEVLKADKSGISAANNFYTHKAKLKKISKGYELTFWVSVKHGLVKFRPVSMQLGPIINRNFARKGNKDVWTYTVKLDSINELKKETSGKLHLSVPIANIHNRVFSVYFKFGVKNITQKTSLPISKSSNSAESVTKSSDSHTDKTSVNSTPISNSQNQSKSVAADPQQAKVKAAENEVPAITSADLAKYQVKPQTNTYAEIALINYPILQAVLIFLLIDGVIVGVAIYLYRKERRN